MTDDSDFELPWPTKVKLAKYALAGATVTVSAIGAFLSFALDSFQAALANVGIAASSIVSVPLQVVGLVLVFFVVFLGAYRGLSQYVCRRIFQLNP